MNRIAKYESPLSTLVKDVFQGFLDPWNVGGIPGAHYSSSVQESISRDETGYTIRLVLPGVPKEQLSVELKNNVLLIAREGRQLRSYLVPEDTDLNGIVAESTDGILTLKVPTKTHPVIKIQVK